jgi:aspartate oxidase
MTSAVRPADLSGRQIVDAVVEERTSVSGTVPSANEVRDLMWRHVGVLRSQRALEETVATLQSWVAAIGRERRAHTPDSTLRCVSSLATAGLLIARAALRRTESRGAHFRTDFPHRDDLHWQKRIAERTHGH